MSTTTDGFSTITNNTVAFTITNNTAANFTLDRSQLKFLFEGLDFVRERMRKGGSLDAKEYRTVSQMQDDIIDAICSLPK